jgi:hypothetical protein
LLSPSEWVKSGRLDLSDWVIHFVHARRPEDCPDPFSWATCGGSAVHQDKLSGEDEERIAAQCEAESEGYIPHGFDQDGPRYWDLDWNDREYPWEPDAHPFTVLTKIVKDGFLRTGWSFRKGKATIYGPNSTVCFTEMPLYALLNYAKKRSDSGLVDTYAVVLKRSELFQAGGRPVIYGLSRPATEAASHAGLGMGYRLLKPESLPLDEQYRYVATDIGEGRTIDWTHEREWRWTDLSRKWDPPGLTIWLKEPKTSFSEVLILVKTAPESKSIRDTLKYLYDSGYNRFSIEMDRESLLATSVLAIENVAADILDNPVLQIDDLPVEKMTTIQPVDADEHTIAAVRAALSEAEKVGRKAAEAFRVKNWPNGNVGDACGYAYVRTYESHSKVTAALLKIGAADPLVESGGYELHGLNFKIREQSIQIEEAGAREAARILTERLGQQFYLWSRLD